MDRPRVEPSLSPLVEPSHKGRERGFNSKEDLSLIHKSFLIITTIPKRILWAFNETHAGSYNVTELLSNERRPLARRGSFS